MTHKTKTEQDLTARVEEIEAEIGGLEDRLRNAEKRVAGADEQLERKEARMRELSPAVFGGDEAARQEFEEAEAEVGVLLRSRRVASDAATSFAKELEGARGRLEEAQKEVHRERYRRLSEEFSALGEERDRLAAEVGGVLERQSDLYVEMQQELRRYDPDGANTLATDRWARRWADGTLKAWGLR